MHDRQIVKICRCLIFFGQGSTDVDMLIGSHIGPDEDCECKQHSSYCSDERFHAAKAAEVLSNIDRRKQYQYFQMRANCYRSNCGKEAQNKRKSRRAVTLLQSDPVRCDKQKQCTAGDHVIPCTM